jgi:leader peptidase (prepilin peptidase)/N-methyltransferase
MVRILGTIFAALLGLAFGSFLNVCLSRWPREESVVKPRSRCLHCGRTLPWWENIPILSWLALRGRCRGCGARIGSRYLVVEAATGALFALEAWQALESLDPFSLAGPDLTAAAINILSRMGFYWLLIALAALDLEHLWLPNRLTLPGILLGFSVNLVLVAFESLPGFLWPNLTLAAEKEIVAIVVGAGIIVLVRWIYWLIRRREGIGLGDAKLMALLGAWLGVPGMLLAFGLGVLVGAATALVLLAVPVARRGETRWAQTQLPLGTYLCIGGIVSGLWGEQIIAAYLRWSGL